MYRTFLNVSVLLKAILFQLHAFAECLPLLLPKAKNAIEASIRMYMYCTVRVQYVRIICIMLGKILNI